MRESSNELFVLEFNKLDFMCQQTFPETEKGKAFKFMYAFRDKLNKPNRNIMQNIINMRNIIAHERFKFIEVKEDSINIVKAFLSGLDRARKHGNYFKIDAEFEMIRTNNLKQLNQWKNEIKSQKNKSKISSNSFLQKIDSHIKSIEETFDKKIMTSTYQKAKDEINEYRRVFSNEKKKTNLESYKKTVINEITAEYYSVIGELNPLSIVKKRSAKKIKIDFINQIKDAEDKRHLESIYEAALDSFDSL